MLSLVDESIADKFLMEEEITADDLRVALRKGTVTSEIVPILNGSAFKNKGVQPLLDAVVDYLPSPIDLPPVQGMNVKGTETVERKPSDLEHFSALAFKIMTAPHVGKLTYFRVYSGQIEKGGQVTNTRTGNKERVGRLLEMHANNQEDIDVARTGDIVAAIGLKNVRTGDTLCDAGASDRARGVRVPRAGHPRRGRAEDQGRPGQDVQGAGRAVRGGPDLPGPHRPRDRPDRDLRHGRAAPRGARRPHAAGVQGGRHRRQAPGRLPRDDHPRRCRRSSTATSSRPAGPGQFAVVVINLEPTGPGGGYEFVDKITGGRIPKEYIPAVDQGIQEALTAGVLAGYPTVDVRATLVDGQYHDVDSSEMAFKIAGSLVFKKAAEQGKPVLLEPIMRVEVVTPDDYMGDVIGDLNSRRGRVAGMEQRGNSQVIRGMVPLSEMFGYATDLRSRTQGRATYTMHFDSYQQMPADKQDEIVRKVRGV